MCVCRVSSGHINVLGITVCDIRYPWLDIERDGAPLRTPAPGECSASGRLIGQIRREPALHALHRFALATRVARNLIVAESADREIARLRMREIQPAHAGRGDH